MQCLFDFRECESERGEVGRADAALGELRRAVTRESDGGGKERVVFSER